MKLHLAILLKVLLLSATGLAQTTISSFVRSNKDSTPIAYATIGIKGKPVGCIADSTGKFTLLLPISFFATDTVAISAIGYKSIYVPINRLPSQKENYLEPQVKLLDEITVSSKKHFLEIGYSSQHKESFSMGWGNDGQGGEAGNVFIMPLNTYKILKVAAKIHTSYDSCWFRLHIRRMENDVPAEELLDRDVILTTTMKRGLIEFNLSEFGYNFSDKEIFVGIEFLKHSAKGAKSLKEKNFMVYTGIEPAKFRSFHKWYSYTNWEEGKGHSFSIRVAVKH